MNTNILMTRHKTNSDFKMTPNKACTLLPYSILDLIKVDTTYLRTVILTASVLSLFTVII